MLNNSIRNQYQKHVIRITIKQRFSHYNMAVEN